MWDTRETNLVARLSESERFSQQQAALEAEAAAVKADLRVRNQDVDRLSRSLANLQQVLDQFQAERDIEVGDSIVSFTTLLSPMLWGVCSGIVTPAGETV